MLLVVIYLAIDHRVVQGLLALALLIGAPLHIYTHFGNELYDYVSPAELAVFQEVAGLAPANIYGGYPAGTYQQTARLDSRNASLPRQEDETTVQDFLKPEDHNWANEALPTYVVLTRGDRAAVRLFRDQPDLIDDARAALAADPTFEMLFENADGVIFGRVEDVAQRVVGAPGKVTARITVVIPTLNAVDFIADCLRGVADQGEVRVIVVDGGSTDGTLERIAMSKVTLKEGPGPGPAAARQVGIEAARSPWVALIDADVILPVGALDDLVHEARRAAPRGDRCESGSVHRQAVGTGAISWRDIIVVRRAATGSV